MVRSSGNSPSYKDVEPFETGEYDPEAILALYSAGWTIESIAYELKVSDGTVSRTISRLRKEDRIHRPSEPGRRSV